MKIGKDTNDFIVRNGNSKNTVDLIHANLHLVRLDGVTGIIFEV